MNQTLAWIATIVAPLSLLASLTSAQTIYGVDSGTTSISLDTVATAGLGYAVTGSSGTVPGQGGLQFGFNILAEVSDFVFTIEEEALAAHQSGILNHSGWIELDDDANPATGIIQLGNFEIGIDSARVSETTSGAYVKDTLGTGAIVFDIKPTGSEHPNPTSDGEALTLHTSDLLLSPELYALLGAPEGISPGAFLGSIRVDGAVSALPVPEPSTGLLVCVGSALVFFRRRRP